MGVRKSNTNTKGHVTFLTSRNLREQLKVSKFLPIIKLLLFNYWYLAEDVIKASKETWDSLKNDIDNILYDEELSDITKSDSKISFRQILKILEVIDNTLIDWLRKLSEEPELAEQIFKTEELIKKAKTAYIPSFNDLREGKNLGV